MKIIQRQKPSFFFCIAIMGLLVVLIGFAKTFIIPMVHKEFEAPLSIHIHGVFAFAWIILFLIQTSLIHYHKYSIHQYLGFLGIFISAGVMVTMIPAGLYVVNRDLSHGVGETSYSSLVGVLTSGILFFSLVISGILNRRSPETHKRLMVLSIIVVLWPAWFRFRHYFPSIPRPDIWFALVLADSMIVIAWIWDRLRNGRIHPVLLYAGLFIILEQTFEVLAFDSPAWQATAKWIYTMLS
jgi:hypothetical protein